jgi:hypothetical protein
MNLLDFLDKQSDGRLILIGVVFVFVVAIIFEGIAEIIRYLKK